MANPVFLTEDVINERFETYVVTDAVDGGVSVKINGETVTVFADLLAKCQTGRAVLYGQATTVETGYAFYTAASVTDSVIQFQVSGMLYDKSNIRYGMYVRRIKIVPRANGGLLIDDSGLLGPYAKKDEVASSVSVAPEFDSTKTYAVDEMVMHGGNLYRCTTAVTTAGAWNEENWTQDTATHGDTAFLKDAQGHLVIRETEGQDGAQLQTLYVDAYRLSQDTVTHAIKDATINEIGEMADGVTLALPPAIAGHSRDFAVELKIGATVPAFVFPLVEADLKPYSDSIPAWAANTVYCISFTEFPDGKWRLGVASKEVTA